MTLGRLERQQPAHAVADHHRLASQRLEPGDHVVHVGVEVELLEIVHIGPEVAAQVERVALPAALREVLQVALPQPRAAQLAVDEEERPPPRSALGQPRLDVEAALLDDDLVLAHRPVVGLAAIGVGDAVATHGPEAHLVVAYHSSGPKSRPVGALGLK